MGRNYFSNSAYNRRRSSACERCGRVHNGLYGSGRFCSVECARRRKPIVWTPLMRLRQMLAQPSLRVLFIPVSKEG